MAYNPHKRLAIEIHSNDGSGCNGYTVWRSINGELKHTMSRNADNADFDWMTDKENTQFENGRYKFSISSEQATNILITLINTLDTTFIQRTYKTALVSAGIEECAASKPLGC